MSQMLDEARQIPAVVQALRREPALGLEPRVLDQLGPLNVHHREHGDEALTAEEPTLGHFTFEPVFSPQHVGMSFSVTIEARDPSDAGPELYALSVARFEPPDEIAREQLQVVHTDRPGWRETFRERLREN